jgi:hypothetical protein
MAQWAYGYSGHTHDTKVLDVEESLRLAVAAHSAATEAERDHKSKAVHHLAERLLAARLKAVRARIARLSEPDQRRKPETADHLERLRKHEAEVEAQGVDGILREFGFHGTVQV